MPVQLGNCVSVAEFIVCEKLAVPLILGVDYFDRFVEAILPLKRKVRLADGFEIQILRRVISKNVKQKLVPWEQEYVSLKGRPSPKVKACSSITIKPGIKKALEFIFQRSLLILIQPYGNLHEQNPIVAMNGVTKVEPNRPFHLSMVNFKKFPVKILKNQILAELLPHSRAVVEDAMTIGEISGL